MQSAYTINISDIEKTVKKAIANGYTVTLEINGEYYDIDTGNQEYEIIKAFDGFSIRKIESNGRYVYLDIVPFRWRLAFGSGGGTGAGPGRSFYNKDQKNPPKNYTYSSHNNRNCAIYTSPGSITPVFFDTHLCILHYAFIL